MRHIRETCDLPALQGRSSALFGSQHRLAVALLAAEAEPEELYAAALAHAAEITRMEAARQLDSLRRAGLLVPGGYLSSGGPGRPPALFRRTDAVAWAGLLALGHGFGTARDECRAELAVLRGACLISVRYSLSGESKPVVSDTPFAAGPGGCPCTSRLHFDIPFWLHLILPFGSSETPFYGPARGGLSSASRLHLTLLSRLARGGLSSASSVIRCSLLTLRPPKLPLCA
jgi:hypothetical protein